jgi:hypothetical protein
MVAGGIYGVFREVARGTTGRYLRAFSAAVENRKIKLVFRQCPIRGIPLS